MPSTDDINDIFDSPKGKGPDTAPSAKGPQGAFIPPGSGSRGGFDIPELGL